MHAKIRSHYITNLLILNSSLSLTKTAKKLVYSLKQLLSKLNRHNKQFEVAIKRVTTNRPPRNLIIPLFADTEVKKT